jgi:hypothetical protein
MNVSMHKLVPASKGAKRILDMLERGVADALERGYLRSVSFALTRAVVKDGVKDATMRETVEEYKFNVRYGSRGEVTLDDARYIGGGDRGDVSVGLSDRTGKTTRMERLSDVDYIKKAAIAMTRCLLSLVKTLENVPDGCAFNIHVSYVNGTPAVYEPPFFEAADATRETTWSKNPFSMSVGKVETEYHGLSLRVRSVLDPAQDTDSGQKSNPGSSQTSSLLDESPSTPVGDKTAADDAIVPMSQDVVVNLSQPKAAAAPTFDDGEVEAQVLDWVKTRRSSGIVDAVACSNTFRAYPFKVIDRAFERLLAKGLVEKNGDRGFVLSSAPKTNGKKRSASTKAIAPQATRRCLRSNTRK